MSFAHSGRLVEDAYAVLGLARTATDAEVRAAWRRTARETHPDVGGDALAFRIAREAYEILTDPVRRAAHDRLLTARAEAPGATPGRPTGGTASRRRSAWGLRGNAGGLLLLAANLAVVLRAYSQLQGSVVQPPYAHGLLFPLSPTGVDIYVLTINLLRVPLLFLVLGTMAVGLLVADWVVTSLGRGPLLPAQLRPPVRLVQMLVPVPLLIGAALAAVIVIVQIVLTILLSIAILVGLWILVAVLLDG